MSGDLTVVEFLRARLDEDEHSAREAGGDSWRLRDHESDYWMVTDGKGDVIVYDEGSPRPEQAEHIARHDPAAVLRDVAAKRRIIEHEDMYGENDRVTCFLAEVYDQHPDYDERWRP